MAGSCCSARRALFPARPGPKAGRGGRRAGAEGGAEGDGLDVPDPYGGDASDFGAVLDLIEAASRHIAARLTELLAGRAPA